MEEKQREFEVAASLLPVYIAHYNLTEEDCIERAKAVAHLFCDSYTVKEETANPEEHYLPRKGEKYYYCKLIGRDFRSTPAIWSDSPADASRLTLGVYRDESQCFYAARRLMAAVI